MKKNKKNNFSREILKLRDYYLYLEKNPKLKKNFYKRIQNLNGKLGILEKKLGKKSKYNISKKEIKLLEEAIEVMKEEKFINNKKEFSKFIFNWQLFLEIESRVDSL